MSHIETQRKAHVDIAERVQKLLAWTPEQYSEHCFEQYSLFLDTVCQDYPDVKTEIMDSPEFTGFWKAEWAKRSMDFLKMCEESYFVDVNGRLIIQPGYKPGDEFAIEEYLFTHDYYLLQEDKAFMDGYAYVLEVIRSNTKKRKSWTK